LGRGKYKATKARGSGSGQRKRKKSNPHTHKRSKPSALKVVSKVYNARQNNAKASKLKSRANAKKEKIRRVKLITKTNSL